MNNNYSINILKTFVLFGSCVAVFGRKIVPTMYVNYYMAVINVISFIVSYNIFLIDIYNELKKVYLEKKDYSIKQNAQRVVMIVYISIFIINIGAWLFLLNTYYSQRYDLALINDILGITSLGLAITYDFISKFIVKILANIFI